MSSPHSKHNLLNNIEMLGSTGTPFSISEVSEVIDCDDEPLREKLAELVADGSLHTKEIGSEQVWWRPVENQTTLDTAERNDEHLSTADVTKCTECGREIKSQQEWRKAIFEGSRDAVFISDTDANFVEVNAAASDLTGYDREELLSMRIPDLHEDVDLDAYREYSDRILDGESMMTEDKLLRADGSKVHVEFSNKRIEIDDDVYMHTTARNVSKQKQRRSRT